MWPDPVAMMDCVPSNCEPKLTLPSLNCFRQVLSQERGANTEKWCETNVMDLTMWLVSLWNGFVVWTWKSLQLHTQRSPTTASIPVNKGAVYFFFLSSHFVSRGGSKCSELPSLAFRSRYSLVEAEPLGWEQSTLCLRLSCWDGLWPLFILPSKEVWFVYCNPKSSGFSASSSHSLEILVVHACVPPTITLLWGAF